MNGHGKELNIDKWRDIGKRDINRNDEMTVNLCMYLMLCSLMLCADTVSTPQKTHVSSIPFHFFCCLFLHVCLFISGWLTISHTTYGLSTNFICSKINKWNLFISYLLIIVAKQN